MMKYNLHYTRIKKILELYKKTQDLRNTNRKYYPPQKKILMLTISQIDIDPRINKVARSLTEAGYEIFILCIQANQDRSPIEYQKIAEKITYVRIKMGGDDYKFICFYQDFFYEASKTLNFDFVHANDLPTLWTAWFISKERGCPLIYDAHEMWSENVIWKKNRWKKFSIPFQLSVRYLEKTLLADVQCFYSVSPSILKAYQLKYRRLPSLLANYPSLNELNLEVKNLPTIRDELNIDDSKFVTIYIGGVSTTRNIEKVIAAHRFLDERFVFVIRGPGVEIFGKDYLNLAEKLGIYHKVKLLPSVERNQVIAAMQGANCGIIMLENLCQNFFWFYPNKLFEYCLGGIPVAVSNFPDVTRHVLSEKVGVTFDPSNVKSIAQSLEWLANNPSICAKMGEAGKKSIITKYNWENAINVMIENYNTLCGD